MYASMFMFCEQCCRFINRLYLCVDWRISGVEETILVSQVAVPISSGAVFRFFPRLRGNYELRPVAEGSIRSVYSSVDFFSSRVLTESHLYVYSLCLSLHLCLSHL